MARMDLVIQAPDIDTPQIKQLARLAEADTITALSGASTQAFRLSPARQRAGVAELCAVAGIDFGFVPDDQRLERVRARHALADDLAREPSADALRTRGRSSSSGPAVVLTVTRS